MTTTTTIAKTPCPLTAEEFLDNAKPLRITVEDGTPVAEGATTVGKQALLAEPKQFNTGSFGYYATGKLDCLVNGKRLKLQVGMNFTVIGSKPQ